MNAFDVTLALGLVAVFLITVWRYGADSRDGQDWHSRRPVRLPGRPPYRAAHSPVRDLVAGGRWILAVATAGVRRLDDFHQMQTTLWERHLHAQRTWEPDPLRWVRTGDGWVLDGRVAPTHPDHASGRSASRGDQPAR